MNTKKVKSSVKLNTQKIRKIGLILKIVTIYALKNFLYFPFAGFAMNGDFQHSGLGDRRMRS